MRWLQALNNACNRNIDCVVVSIVEVDGSTPRDVGARMVVTEHDASDTIGGGALELEAIAAARSILAENSNVPLIRHNKLILGSALSQCCGGSVKLQYELHPKKAFELIVFGAGHVAQALAKIVHQLDCHATFYDTRQSWLDQLPSSETAQGVLLGELMGNNPFELVEQCADQASYLVMTHSHELDYDLVEAILSKPEVPFCGLIASKSKAAKFRSKLRKQQFTGDELGKLITPIGQAYATGNLPMEIAVAVSAELLALNAAHQLNRAALKIL